MAVRTARTAMTRGTSITGQAEQDKYSGTGRTGHAVWNRQNKLGQVERDMQYGYGTGRKIRTGRTGKAELDRQNRTLLKRSVNFLPRTMFLLVCETRKFHKISRFTFSRDSR
jgi:hypothetical protein